MLRNLVLVAASLALGFAPAPARAASASPGDAATGYQRTIELGPNAIELRVQQARSAGSSDALSGEGTVATQLPGDGHLTLRLPYVVAQAPVVGTAQLAASYSLANESPLVPSVAVAAHVDLPTAPGARGARPGVRASAMKTLGLGVIDTVRVESELWTDGATLTPSYRALVGTTFRLLRTTSGSLELVALRPSAGTGAVNDNLVQLAVSHRLDPATNLHFGVAAGLAYGVSPLRVTLGLDHRF